MWIIILSILGLAIAGVFISCDRLVKFEYDNCRIFWNENGKPFGMFWMPKESQNSFGFQTMRSNRALRSRQLKWLFFNPVWYDGQPKVKTLLLVYRLSIIIPIISIITSILFLYLELV